MADEYAYMDNLIKECRKKGYSEMELDILGIMSGSAEAHYVYGSSQKAFEQATKFVKESSSPEEAIEKFSKTILELPS